MNLHTGARRLALLCAAMMALAGPIARAEQAPRWELTVGASGKQTAGGWKIALPEAELQYQWNERIELNARLSWVHIHPAAAPSKSGPGIAEIGVKALLLQDAGTGFELSFAPQLARFIARSSVRRGIVSQQRELVLPIETKFTAAGTDFELTTGRNLVEGAPDEWLLELKAVRRCLPRADCTLALERKFVPAEPSRTLVKPGIDWKLSDTLTLKTALGRETGPRDADRKNLVLSAGLKVAF